MIEQTSTPPVYICQDLLDQAAVVAGWERDFRAQGVKRFGAVVTFTGHMRDFSEDASLCKMHLECYTTMAHKALQNIRAQAIEKFDLMQACIAHRTGDVTPTDTIVCVWVVSEHRKQAFDAAMYMMDYLKISAPFWKKEYTEGASTWVASKESDAKAAAHW